MRQRASQRFDNVHYRHLRGDVVLPGQRDLRHVIGEGKIRHFCQRAGVVIGDGDDFAAVKAELTGEAQDLFGSPETERIIASAPSLTPGITG